MRTHPRNYFFIIAFSLLNFIGCATKVETSRAPTQAKQNHFNRIFIVVLENTDYSLAVAQPNLAKLASNGALLKNYYSLYHPSEPNYLAMISGVNSSVLDDDQYSLEIKTIADLLEKKGLTWKAYAENYTGNCTRGDSGVDPIYKKYCDENPAACAKVCPDKNNPMACWPLFADRHVPFLSIKNINADSQRCNSHVVPESNFQQVLIDAENGTLPNFSFYTPNLDNDGHNFGSGAGIQWADKNWIGTYLMPLISNPKFMKDTLLVITFDEDGDENESDLGATIPGQKNHIYTVLYGDSVKAGSSSSEQYTHFSLLRTIEDNFGLGQLGSGDSSAAPIQDVWFQP